MTATETVNPGLARELAILVDTTARKLLWAIQTEGTLFTVERRSAASLPQLISEGGDCLDISSWNAWIEVNHPELVEQLIFDESEITLYDKPLTRLDVIRILRKTVFRTDGTGLYISLSEALELYNSTHSKGEKAFNAFMEFVTATARSHKLIA